MKFFGGVVHGPRNSRLDFSGGPDHDPHPAFLHSRHDPRFQEFSKGFFIYYIAIPLDRKE